MCIILSSSNSTNDTQLHVKVVDTHTLLIFSPLHSFKKALVNVNLISILNVLITKESILSSKNYHFLQ
ncbi:hypothetical protein KQS06HV_90094 [Klebsiella quasipneumoniae subsp. similipneumoniae]|nr:hypothetical protein KQS06HV_90094 [Klebsiella quasipneumoniae subsp. similipneumoniae]